MSATATTKSNKPETTVATNEELLARILDKVEGLESKALNDANAALVAKYEAEKALEAKAGTLLKMASRLNDSDAEIEALRAAVKQHEEKVTPVHPLISLIGQTNADRFAERFKAARDVKDSRKLGKELSDEITKRQIDDKAIEGKFRPIVQMDESTAMWTGIGVGVLGLAVTAGVGYVCYERGVERGHLEMHDALNNNKR